MPDNDQPDTELAPTEQASAETTELPPATHAAETPEAWSLDDTAEVDSGSAPRGRLLSVGLVGLVVVVAGALIFLATTLFGSRSPKPVEPKAQPTTTVPVAAPHRRLLSRRRQHRRRLSPSQRQHHRHRHYRAPINNS